MTTNTSDKLLAKLKQHPELVKLIHPRAILTRNHPSVADRKAGAWIWYVGNNGDIAIGSQCSMATCIKSKYISVKGTLNSYEVIPEDDC